MTTAEETVPRGGFHSKLSWRMFGSAAPVFPGFDVDILARVPDDEKPDAVWHRERARAILRAHPEVKELFGHAPWSAIACIGAASAQLALAVWSGFLPWWGMLLLAYFVGSSINIMLFQLGHECVHGLVFKRSSWNRWLFTYTTLPMFLSGHHTWWMEHLVHHSDMGAKKDFITRRRSYFLLTRMNSPMFFPYSLLMLVMQLLRSIVGLVMYAGCLLTGRLRPGPRTLAVLSDNHLVSGYEQERVTLWAVAYPLISLAICVGLFLAAGWQSVAYLLASATFFTGFLHPYCLGWVLGISHFHGRRRYQPTASHYGVLLNLASFNAGLHVEHHDLAGIPWFRMWKLNRIAHEFYDDLTPIRSYTLLGLSFVFCGRQTFEEEFGNEELRNLRRFSSSGV